VREEAVLCKKRNKDALKGSFTNKQSMKEVPWPEVPQDLRHWNQRKKGERGTK
jgi:hypothetical protein